MSKRRDQILNRFMRILHTDDVMWANEVRANILVSVMMLLCAFLLVVTKILNTIGIFKLSIMYFDQLILLGFIGLSIPFCLCVLYKGQKKWLKFAMLIELVAVFSMIDAILTHRVVLLMVLPVVLSSRYYSKELTIVTAISTVIMFFISSYVSAKIGILNLNDVVMKQGELIVAQGGLLHDSVRMAGFDTGEYIKSIIINSYLPKLEIFVLISMVCAEIAERSKELVLKQEELTVDSAKIDSELKMAADIQMDLLPNEFLDKEEFNLYADMIPAKAVGGDFYDFFMVDESHLAFVVADVSDKGVPAALFMVKTKTLIKANMQGTTPVNEVFDQVNNLLCEGNKAGLFVTAWLGLLNIHTGHVNFVNAGHNNPIVMRNGQFEELTQYHGFVLAGMEDLHYKRQEMNLKEGDILFIYTDGITDANNKNKELFGVDRLIYTLNNANKQSMFTLCEDVIDKIEKFGDGTEQFDDITLLAIQFKGSKKEIDIKAKKENIEKVTKLIDEELEKNNCSSKVMHQINVIIDEVIANISDYAYKPGEGYIKIKYIVHKNPLTCEIEFIDNGKLFNPLIHDDPDFGKKAEDRKDGGLGIYLMKKLMDSVEYSSKDGMNVLKIKKEL